MGILESPGTPCTHSATRHAAGRAERLMSGEPLEGVGRRLSGCRAALLPGWLWLAACGHLAGCLAAWLSACRPAAEGVAQVSPREEAPREVMKLVPLLKQWGLFGAFRSFSVAQDGFHETRHSTSGALEFTRTMSSDDLGQHLICFANSIRAQFRFAIV